MTIGLGIIGCSGHAVHHAKYMSSVFRIVNVWDPDHPAMEKIQSERRSSTLDQLLDDKEVEAVHIASPDQFHVEQMQLALEAGKHVLCEKPLVPEDGTLEPLIELIKFSRNKELVLTTCHPRRFEPSYVWLRERVCNAESEFVIRLGPVIRLEYNFTYQRQPHQTSLLNGTSSLLAHHINHEVDIMNFLLGIQAFSGWKLHDNFKHYEVVGVREDKVTFHLCGTQYLVKEDTKSLTRDEKCRVFFERGEVTLDFWHEQFLLMEYESRRPEPYVIPLRDYDGRVRRVMGAFARQIQGGSAEYSDAELLMNTEAGLILQQGGVQYIPLRS